MNATSSAVAYPNPSTPTEPLPTTCIHGDEENINGDCLGDGIVKLPDTPSKTPTPVSNSLRNSIESTPPRKLSKAKSVGPNDSDDDENTYNSKSDDDLMYLKTKNGSSFINTNTTLNLYNHVTDLNSSSFAALSLDYPEHKQTAYDSSIPPSSFVLSRKQSELKAPTTCFPHPIHHCASLSLPLPSQDSSISRQTYKMLITKGKTVPPSKSVAERFAIPKRYDFDNNKHSVTYASSSFFYSSVCLNSPMKSSPVEKKSTPALSGTPSLLPLSSSSTTTTSMITTPLPKMSPSVLSFSTTANSTPLLFPSRTDDSETLTKYVKPLSTTLLKDNTNILTNNNNVISAPTVNYSSSLLNGPMRTPSMPSRLNSLSSYSFSNSYLRKDEIRWRRSFEHVFPPFLLFIVDH